MECVRAVSEQCETSTVTALASGLDALEDQENSSAEHYFYRKHKVST